MIDLIIFGEVISEIKVIEKNDYYIAKFTVFVEHQPENRIIKRYFQCTAFGEIGKEISKTIKKNDKILGQGYLETGSYKNKEGKKVWTTDIIIQSVEVL